MASTRPKRQIKTVQRYSPETRREELQDDSSGGDMDLESDDDVELSGSDASIHSAFNLKKARKEQYDQGDGFVEPDRKISSPEPSEEEEECSISETSEDERPRKKKRRANAITQVPKELKTAEESDDDDEDYDPDEGSDEDDGCGEDEEEPELPPVSMDPDEIATLNEIINSNDGLSYIPLGSIQPISTI